MEMDERKLRILQAIIDDYILTAVPVGSRTISKKYDMGLSSATIRNEMSDLEELGYLDQPHVSAVVLPPKGREPRIRTLQLVPVSAVSALVVIVTDSGIVRDTVIRISDQLDSDALYAISRMLTKELAGLTLGEAGARIPEISRRMQRNEAVLSGVHQLLNDAGEKPVGHVAVGGSSNMLSYPEYSDVEKARNFLSLMETRDKLAKIIANQGEMAFTVRIGPETGVPEMADCSIVTATYQSGGGRKGTIGIIGPTRMQYSKVLSILGTMGQQLSRLLQESEDNV